MDSPIKYLDRKIKLCSSLPVKDGVGIEFGPLSRPIIKESDGDIRYVDALSNDELRAAFEGQPYYDVAEFVKISYAWKSGPLVSLTGNQKFDYALASHVIEHVPDVLGWLNYILDALKDDGQIALAIPDKRYTFDATRDDTPVAQYIDLWLRKAKVPQPIQIYDHFSHAIKLDLEHFKGIWDGTVDIGQIERYHTDKESFSLALGRWSDGAYIDCHASAFTPRSFLTAISSFIQLGILDVKVNEFFDTLYYANEFIVVLQKKTYSNNDDRMEEINRIASYFDGLNSEKKRSPNAANFVTNKAKLEMALKDLKIAHKARDTALNETLMLRASLDAARKDALLAHEALRVAEQDRGLLRNEVSLARASLSCAEMDRDSVLNSRTWRLFEPYRRLMQLIRNI